MIPNHTSEPNEAASRIDAAADEDGPGITEALSTLANEIRLAILLALWETFELLPDGRRNPTDGDSISAPELQEHIGYFDSDELNAHLAALGGQFIEQDGDGYQLLPEGKSIIRTVITTTSLEEPEFEEMELDLNFQDRLISYTPIPIS